MENPGNSANSCRLGSKDGNEVAGVDQGIVFAFPKRLEQTELDVDVFRNQAFKCSKSRSTLVGSRWPLSRQRKEGTREKAEGHFIKNCYVVVSGLGDLHVFAWSVNRIFAHGRVARDPLAA